MSEYDEHGHVQNKSMWTVQDSDGVVHRAIQQWAGSISWVITACPWWQTHNISGQKAEVRTDRAPTCLECTRLEILAVSQPKCLHCGAGRHVHNSNMHPFEVAAYKNTTE